MPKHNNDDNENEMNSVDLDADTAQYDDIDELDEEFHPDGELKSDKDKIKKLKETLKKAEGEKKEYLDGWQRARADIANLQKEMDVQKKKSRELGIESIAYDMLSVIDSFESAMKNREAWEAIDKNWRIGVEYIKSQAEKVLADYNVKPITIEIGSVFNPDTCEPAQTIETDDETKKHTVESIIQTGYMINDRVLRHVRVSIYE